MEQRPQIKLSLTTIDKAMEILGWVSIVIIWSLLISSYSNLPNIIPTHFNGAGKANAYGSKSTIFSLPAISTILFVGLTILNKFPHIFNYPTVITKNNALIQYTNATRMIRYLKLIIVFIFGLLTFKTIQHTEGKATGLGIWFLPLTMALIFIPLTYFIVKLFNAKK